MLVELVIILPSHVIDVLSVAAYVRVAVVVASIVYFCLAVAFVDVDVDVHVNVNVSVDVDVLDAELELPLLWARTVEEHGAGG